MNEEDESILNFELLPGGILLDLEINPPINAINIQEDSQTMQLSTFEQTLVQFYQRTSTTVCFYLIFLIL